MNGQNGLLPVLREGGDEKCTRMGPDETCQGRNLSHQHIFARHRKASRRRAFLSGEAPCLCPLCNSLDGQDQGDVCTVGVDSSHFQMVRRLPYASTRE